jgi:hypothetical protein
LDLNKTRSFSLQFFATILARLLYQADFACTTRIRAVSFWASFGEIRMKCSLRPLAAMLLALCSATTRKKIQKVFVLVFAIALLLGAPMPGSAQQNTQNNLPFGKSAAGLSGLPADAQGPIAAALGKDDSGYWVRAVANGLRGENPRQAFSVNFGRQGAEVRSHDLCSMLETRAYGYGSVLHPVKAAAPQANANRVEYRRDGITEWYENGPLGLEQGFTLTHPPGRPNGQPLTLELELRGDLSASLEPASLDKRSTTLELRGKDGTASLRYTGLQARDATGRELRSWLEMRGERLLVQVDDIGARYPVVVDPWIQQAELTSSDGAANDFFGESVAVSGSTVVIGAPYHKVGSNAGQGAAYVFVQSGTTWTQQAELTSSDGAAQDEFGLSVAISGSTIVVGAPFHAVGSNAQQGVAYVFVLNGTNWSQQAELTSSDGAAGDYFGETVAIGGSTVFVGAPYHAVGSNTNQGSAYVFVQSGTNWSQQQELLSADGAAGDFFGGSVSISGSKAVVGASAHTVGSNAQQGVAYIYDQSGTNWSQQTELTSSDGAAGDRFGLATIISSDTVLATAPLHKVGSNASQGAAYVFAESGTTWSQQAELIASDGGAGDYFGYSAGLSGSTVTVGAPLHTVGSNQYQGAAYVFAGSGGTWSQQAELTASDGAPGDALGISATVNGNTSIVGSENHTVGSNADQGTAYIFVPTTTVTLTPGSLSFGNVAVDNTSAVKTVTLKNTGTVTLDIGNISAAPTANFTISSNTCSGTLAVNKTCKVGVTFTTSQTGEATGTLSLSGNTIPSPQTVALSGTGVAQTMLTPIDVSFPTTKVGRISTQSVTLKNNLPTTLTGISYTITPPFGIASTSTCGTTLNSKASCVFKVTFSPTATGPASGIFTVTNSANDSPLSVSLEGDGD